jgi:glycosyltransferase involved in cell wall biosynthesis
MTSPIVSVNIPTFNRKGCLKKALLSVCNQSFNDFEIIVIDDCSTDGTSIMMEKFIVDKPFIKYLRHSINKGLSEARNYGVNSSSGKYIAFLDDDDIWKKNKLEEQLKIINNSDSENFICYTSILKKEKNKETIINLEKPSNPIKRLLVRNGFLYPSTIIIPRDLILKSDMWDSKFSRGIDSDFYRRLLFYQKTELIYLNNPLTIYESSRDDRITNQVSVLDKLKSINVNILTLNKYKDIYSLNKKEKFHKTTKTIRLIMGVLKIDFSKETIIICFNKLISLMKAL